MRKIFKVGTDVTPDSGFIETIEEFYDENEYDEGSDRYEKYLEASVHILRNGNKRLAMVSTRADDEGWMNAELVAIHAPVTKEESDEIYHFLRDRGGYHSVLSEFDPYKLKRFDECINDNNGLVMFYMPERGLVNVFPMNVPQEV